MYIFIEVNIHILCTFYRSASEAIDYKVQINLIDIDKHYLDIYANYNILYYSIDLLIV